MVNINDYSEEKCCTYKGEEYLVRDNGAVLRKIPQQKRARKLDNQWTFGKKNNQNGYSFFFGTNIRVHQIVATAFHGEQPTKEHIVDHIDTNRQNNRPDNLRWITKEENILNNEKTRKKIEYSTGVSAEEFLKNPSKYRSSFGKPDVSHMRPVSQAEAIAYSKNIENLGKTKRVFINKHPQKLESWIYNIRDPYVKMESWLHDTTNSNYSVLKSKCESEEFISNSLTPLAKQKDWKTPAKFVCCPNEVEGDPILCYLKNLSEDAIFTENQYGKSTIVKYASVDNNAIFIITASSSSVKPFGLAKVTFENGYYLHTSLGSFFTEKGAEKRFTLAQGLEWTGGDSFDDYC